MIKRKAEITAEEVIDRYADMVYRLAVSQVKKQADAEDIFQEVFIRLVRHIGEIQSMEHARAWLITVTTNCARKHFGNYWNKNVSLTEKAEEIQKDEEGYEQVERETGSPVLEAVGKLSPKYRGVIHLFYFEELSIAEIADVTKQKESTVKSQLFRAREMLKEILTESKEDGNGR